jgi:two-component sensor histidine kinase
VVSDGTGAIICHAGTIPADATDVLKRTVEQNSSTVLRLAERVGPDAPVVLAKTVVSRDGLNRAIGVALSRSAFESLINHAGVPYSIGMIRAHSGHLREFAPVEQAGWLPAEIPLTSAHPGGVTSGRARNADGLELFYALAPVPGTKLSVLATSPLRALATQDLQALIRDVGLPLLVLALGVVALLLGINQLVLRWVHSLLDATASYARGDYSYRVTNLENAPFEFAELGASLNSMAQRIDDRSHALEHAVSGKTLLLRELHHRVKNNFQMIASLLALQRRELPNRLRTLLRIPEDRVLAMASAYKASYASGEIGLVSLPELMRDIAGQLRQSFGLAAPIIQLSAATDEIALDLDRAVPLGLLVSEIMTAALDRTDSAVTPIHIRVSRGEDSRILVEIASRQLVETVPTMGLASRLIAAYQTQLDAQVNEPTPDSVVISLAAFSTSSDDEPSEAELIPH